MKKIALEVQLKRKVFSLKWKLLKHKIEYMIYQHPDDAFFWFGMFGLFLVQVMLYVGR